MLQSMGLQRVGHDLVTQQQQRKQNGARTFKASAYVMSAKISLAKVSHVAKSNSSGAGSLLAESLILSLDLVTGEGRINQRSVRLAHTHYSV